MDGLRERSHYLTNVIRLHENDADGWIGPTDAIL